MKVIMVVDCLYKNHKSIDILLLPMMVYSWSKTDILHVDLLTRYTYNRTNNAITSISI